MVDMLLDELAAAMSGIEHAPVGLSRGVLGSALGPVKKVNPYDQALVKKIPAAISELARQTDRACVFQKVRDYPDKEVVQQVMDALSG